MGMKTYKNIDEYISDFDPAVQELLQQFRKTVKNAAPDALESVSYGMPVYKLHGVLVYFGAFKKHIGFFPGPSGVEAFIDRLSDFKTSKGTIQFPYNIPIPLDLVKEIVHFKVDENTKKVKSKKK
jgi:uncharacterized protein YdhG (YjbR/CyaY superfamily)